MSKRYGYARVSTDDQSLDIQREKLKAFGCDVVLEEKVSAGSMDGRHELQLILKVIGSGDVLVVTKTDRLGRDLLDQATIAKQIETRGAGIIAIDEAIDTRTEAGRLYFHLMSVFAEQERRRIRARQQEGIAKAKQDGRYKGGVKRFDDAMIWQLSDEGKGATEIKEAIGAKSTMTVYRALARRPSQTVN